MNAGGPNGATPSRRIDAGRSKPACTRPRSFWSPARPDSDSSAVSVRIPLQPRVSSAWTAAKSGRGVPVSVGRERCFAAQPLNTMQRTPGARCLMADVTEDRRPHATLRSSGIWHLAFRILDLLLNLLFVRRSFTNERLRPRIDGLLPARAAGGQSPDVLQHLSVLWKFADRLGQIFLGLVEIPFLEVRPAETVEIRRIAGIFLQRLIHQPDRLVETIVIVREHVPEKIERIGIRRIRDQHLAQHLLGVG